MISSSPRGEGLRLLGEFDDLVVVEIEAGDGVVGFRLLRLFFEAEHLAGLDRIRRRRSARGPARDRRRPWRPALRLVGMAENLVEIVAVENVVAEDERRIARCR